MKEKDTKSLEHTTWRCRYHIACAGLTQVPGLPGAMTPCSGVSLIPGGHIDYVNQRFAVKISGKIGEDDFKDAFKVFGLVPAAGNMRRNDGVRRVPERMFRGQRLRVGHDFGERRSFHQGFH